jgi:NAD+ synthase
MTAPAAFELPTELAIDTDVARRVIGEFIRGQLRQAGFDRAVLGLSGGIDSALVAYLTAEAIGADKVLTVLMPYRTSSPASQGDAEEVVSRLKTASELVDITPMVDGFYGPASDASSLRRGNFMARQRMAVLYDRSVTWGGLVVGTGNKTESLIGYTTIFGDSACAFNPIGDLYKSQVRQLAAAIGVPDEIIRKAPSADLWPGQTDETEGGFDYPTLDRLLFWRIDKRRSIDEVVALGFPRDVVEKVDRMVAGAEFKRQVPPIAKLGPRTAGVDYLYPRRRPGSARRCGDRGRRRDAVRRRDAHRQPVGHHAAGHRGPRLGPPDRRRGHAPHPSAAGAARDRGTAGQLPRAQRPEAARRAGGPPARWGGPGARHRCRHAGGQ